MERKGNPNFRRMVAAPALFLALLLITGCTLPTIRVPMPGVETPPRPQATSQADPAPTRDSNDNGQPAEETATQPSAQVAPDPITPITNVTSVTAGQNHSVALKHDGTVWAWGGNTVGQLGDGTMTDRHTPVQVMLDATTPLTGITSVSAGASHTVALRNDGTVWAWGFNISGQLGHGTIDHHGLNPVQVMLDAATPLSGITRVSASDAHTVALRNDGTVWAWGFDRANPVQVMLDATTPLTDVKSVAAGGGHTVALKNDGTVLTWGRSHPIPVMLDATTPLTDTVAIAAGAAHTVALKNDGSVWAWGDNRWGAIGDGTTTNRHNPTKVMLNPTTPLTGVTSVFADVYGAHTVALRNDGTVWAWGNNSSGQLGDGTTVHRHNPVQVMLDATTPLTNITSIAAGGEHTVALRNDGTVWAWGGNSRGQLGDGTRTSRHHNPMQVMLDMTTAQRSNGNGQSAEETATQPSAQVAPDPITPITDVTSVTATASEPDATDDGGLPAVGPTDEMRLAQATAEMDAGDQAIARAAFEQAQSTFHLADHYDPVAFALQFQREYRRLEPAADPPFSMPGDGGWTITYRHVVAEGDFTLALSRERIVRWATAWAQQIGRDDDWLTPAVAQAIAERYADEVFADPRRIWGRGQVSVRQVSSLFVEVYGEQRRLAQEQGQ